MTDNIFDRLAELLQSAGPVNWRLAAQIAESVAGPADALDPWVAEEYRELGRTAAMLVGSSAVLDTAALAAPIPRDPRGWASSAVEGYAYLGEPLAAKLSAGPGSGAPMGLEQVFSQLGPALVGLQVGGLVGAMAREVLGDFDAGLPPAPGAPSLVVPHVEAFAAGEGLDVRQVRLWAAVRETAHRAQMAIPWVPGHLAALVGDYLEGLEFRPDQFQDGLQGLGDPEVLERLVSEPGGLAGFTAGPGQEAAGDAVAAAAAFLDGHGRAVAAEVAGGLLPDLEAIEAAATRRRAAGGPGRILEQMLGLALDPDLGGSAEWFCGEVGRRWGDDARARLWSGPGTLPSRSEIGDPLGWAARVLLPDDL